MQPAIRIEQDQADRRADSQRMPVGHVTTVRSPGGQPKDVVVLDLSSRGLLYQSDLLLPVDTIITVGLAGAGSAQATIVRRDGDRHGAAFLRPLTPQQLTDAFAGGAAIHPLFVDATEEVSSWPSDERWPRPTRGAVMIASALTAWGAVAAVAMVLGMLA